MHARRGKDQPRMPSGQGQSTLGGAPGFTDAHDTDCACRAGGFDDRVAILLEGGVREMSVAVEKAVRRGAGVGQVGTFAGRCGGRPLPAPVGAGGVGALACAAGRCARPLVSRGYRRSIKRSTGPAT